MKIKKLQIKNFKSLVDFELEDLKPFCAFVGPNASGKSNIFEALEFLNFLIKYGSEAPGFFGGKQSVYSYFPTIVKSNVGTADHPMLFDMRFADGLHVNFVAGFAQSESRFGTVGTSGNPTNEISPLFSSDINDLGKRNSFIRNWIEGGYDYEGDFEQFADNFSRIFINKQELRKTPAISSRLSLDASNLPQVIGFVFEDAQKRADFTDWVRLLIPEFERIEVRKSNLDGSYDFLLYEKSSRKPFPRNLISDGTKSILALMAAVFQTEEPQFLCIEEPENGLHPQAIELLIDFFREKCEEEGHYIWLNTHSPTLVRCMEIDEIILVNKVDGVTHAKQMTKADEVNIKTDEAWLTNALGGGVLWSK
ncbi:MAG TPA: ATP-binding protein [Puia sp.]|jgi:energy-coupling factor transporter ATP-binding protein EcfA2|nr:ATP-binding protein [Puia sp.]